MSTARRTEPALRLLRRAAGPLSGWPAKSARVAFLLGRYAGRRHRIQLERLRALGLVDAVPNDVQLTVGAIDMLRFWISPAAADYYAEQGIDYTFHQVLRFLDDPAGLGDPVGFFSERDAIIGHLMQVVHANPVYDLQLLMLHDAGLDALERQLTEMLDGTHPRAHSISAIVEEPDYHQRLLDYVRVFRADPRSPPPLRKNIEGRFDALERTFGSLPGAMRYFCRLPKRWPAGLAHLRQVHGLLPELAEPEPDSGAEPAPGQEKAGRRE